MRRSAVPYCIQVKARLTAWLSLFLLLGTVFTLPVSGSNTNRTSCAIVYSQQRKHRAEQIAQPQLPPRPAPLAYRAGPRRERAAAAISDSHLFQRPPPTFS
jgi:cbb3-type cytochrome oxidase subunit 3